MGGDQCETTIAPRKPPIIKQVIYIRSCFASVRWQTLIICHSKKTGWAHLHVESVVAVCILVFSLLTVTIACYIVILISLYWPSKVALARSWWLANVLPWHGHNIKHEFLNWKLLCLIRIICFVFLKVSRENNLCIYIKYIREARVVWSLV